MTKQWLSTKEWLMDRLAQVGLSIVGAVVAFIPVELYWLANYFLEPTGFWQQLLLGVIVLYFLGGIQIFLLGLLVYWLYMVWFDF